MRELRLNFGIHQVEVEQRPVLPQRLHDVRSVRDVWKRQNENSGPVAKVVLTVEAKVKCCE